MHAVRDAVFDLLGLAIVAVTLVSVVRSTILPRGVRSRIAAWVFQTTRVVFRLRTGRSPTYERRDKVMAMYGPITLLGLLTTWYVLLFLGFASLYLGVATNDVGRAIRLSGSGMFTLGTTSDPRVIPSLTSYVQAGLGLLVLTLLITYLPTLYTIFSERESSVAALQVRAGSPPTAWNLLIRYYRIGSMDRMSELWQTWEGWFAALEESHVSFPALPYFRSPQPDQSWVTAGGTVLDTASLWVSTVVHPNDPDAQLCIRAGYIALRRIAAFFRVPFDPDPQPDDPITIARSEYDEACRWMEQAGVPLVADREASWRAFKGWRVNYDTVLLNLARLVEAPTAPWTGDRSPLSPEQRWTLRKAIIQRRPTGGRRWRRRGRRG
jgi:hypothetical protein